MASRNHKHATAAQEGISAGDFAARAAVHDGQIAAINMDDFSPIVPTCPAQVPVDGAALQVNGHLFLNLQRVLGFIRSELLFLGDDLFIRSGIEADVDGFPIRRVDGFLQELPLALQRGLFTAWVVDHGIIPDITDKEFVRRGIGVVLGIARGEHARLLHRHADLRALIQRPRYRDGLVRGQADVARPARRSLRVAGDHRLDGDAEGAVIQIDAASPGLVSPDLAAGHAKTAGL